MNVLAKILQRAFSWEFYSQNAMFFLLVMGLAFGFMRGQEHMALGEFIVSSPVCILIPLAVWIFYAFKIIGFNSSVCQLKEMTFAFNLALLPPREQVPALLAVTWNQFLPATAYGMFIIAIGIRHSLWGPVTLLAGALLILLGVITASLYRDIRYPHVEVKLSLLKQWTDQKFEKNFTRIFSEWLIRKHPGMVLFTKAGSCAFLFAVCQLYRFDDYDHRLLAMGSIISFSTMLAFVYQYVLFENHFVDLLRNLPFTLVKRIFLFIMVMTVFSLPEVIIIIRFYPAILPYHHGLEITVLGLVWLLAGYAQLVRKNIAFENFSTRIFLATITLLVVLLFKIPLLLIAAAGVAYAVLTYRKYFYRFEIIVDKNNFSSRRRDDLSLQNHF